MYHPPSPLLVGVCNLFIHKKTMSFEVFDARLKTPFSAVVAGLSMCEKSLFSSYWSLGIHWWIVNLTVWSYGQKTEALEKI